MRDAIPQEALRELETAVPCRLTDLTSCPRKPGVYTLWHEKTFLYVGIARRDPLGTTNRAAAGILGRLTGYGVKNRLDSDFIVKVFLRFIVPSLSSADCARLGTGTIGLREMSKRVGEYVEQHVTYRAWACDGKTAGEVESHIRRHGLPGAGKPVFNAI